MAGGIVARRMGTQAPTGPTGQSRAAIRPKFARASVSAVATPHGIVAAGRGGSACWSTVDFCISASSWSPQLGHLNVTTNAARTTVDLTETSVATMSGSVNAGMLSITLPATADVVGSIEVNAGGLDVCAPSQLGLRVHHTGALSGFSVNGRHQAGTVWGEPDRARRRPSMLVELLQTDPDDLQSHTEASNRQRLGSFAR